jgi:endonuclease III
VGKPSRVTAGPGKPPAGLSRVLSALRAFYGQPSRPLSDPFELVLWENVAYLADDARREEAFRMLREKTGLSPSGILRCSPALLREIARKGILPADRAEKLRAIATIALEEFGGNVAAFLASRPTKEATKALRKFPSIGEPGAEKILLFAGLAPLLALDSNGLRVLLRLGYGTEEKTYAASYKAAQRAASAEVPEDFEERIGAHQLLRRHGQELCRRSAPVCERCPVARECAYFRNS